MLLPMYVALILGVLLTTAGASVGVEAAKTCTLRPLGPGMDDTDQV